MYTVLYLSVSALYCVLNWKQNLNNNPFKSDAEGTAASLLCSFIIPALVTVKPNNLINRDSCLLFNLYGFTKQLLCSNGDLQEARGKSAKLYQTTTHCSSVEILHALLQVTNEHCLRWCAYFSSCVRICLFPTSHRQNWNSDKRATIFRDSSHLTCSCISAPRRPGCNSASLQRSSSGGSVQLTWWTPGLRMQDRVWHL